MHDWQARRDRPYIRVHHPNHRSVVQIIFCLKGKSQKKTLTAGFSMRSPMSVSLMMLVPCQYSLPSIIPGRHLISTPTLAAYVRRLQGEIWHQSPQPTRCFEYKMSNILDKPLESIFGYITVPLIFAV